MLKRFALWLVLLLPYAGGFMLYRWYSCSLEQVANARVIIISKQEMNLRVVDYRGAELLNVPIATGLNPGNKQQHGDMRTPEGVFTIAEIQDASGWKHDFGDGNGKIEGAYGRYFIRLNTPGHNGIGIHGTHDPASIGSRITEGCIRVSNDDLETIVALIRLATVVIITPAGDDIVVNTISNL